jgi:preprotein translocase SecF subunit
MKFITIFDPKNPLNFVGRMRSMMYVHIAIPVLSILMLATVGVDLGLDFSGGTEMQVKFDKNVSSAEIRAVLATAGFEKNQVQQYGASEDNEVLIRIERLTSLTEENINAIKTLLKDNIQSLSQGATAGPDAISVEFRPEEGDRVTIKIPAPALKKPAAKNKDAVAIEAALVDVLGPDQKGEKPLLTDSALGKLSGLGFDRGAVVEKAKELNHPIAASEQNQKEAPWDEIVQTQNILDAQQKELSKLLDEKSGAKLRRTKKTDQEDADISDSVHRDEPYKGYVKYLVHFTGVSSDIEKSLVKEFGSAETRRVEFVDAQVAEQLQTDGAFAVIVALMFILIYVAVRFDLFFSPGAVIALIHDALGALLLFSLPIAAIRLEFNLPSIAALLTVVGYSINNTIVVFDRIRETLPRDPKQPLTMEQVENYVNNAINDTFSRTINTSLTTLAASLALFFFAGGAVQNFALVLSVGIVLGAISSTFLAPSSYLFFRRHFYRPEDNTKSRGQMSREDKARGIV